jgi:hypothetical protein
LFSLLDQITSNVLGFADRLGELENEVYMQGTDDWPTIEKEKTTCQNCFCSTHATLDYEYVITTVISESPLKQAVFDDHGVDCVEFFLSIEVKKNCELDDDDLNEAYDELLT